MANLKFIVNADEIASQFQELKEEVKSAINQGVKQVASMTYAKTQELASSKLNSTRSIYLDNLTFKEVSPNLWVVSLNEKAMWIEEGRKCVVYKKGSSHVPKVLTPDGEISILKLKKGMLVLNKNGEWTKVLEIYDEFLVEKSTYEWQKIEICNFDPKNKKKHKRVSQLGVAGTCVKCGHMIAHKKWSKKIENMRCQKCLDQVPLVQIELGNWSKNKGKNNQKLTLTADHKVWTDSGWKEAGKLCPKNDKIYVPSWNICKKCNKPTMMGRNFCYDKNGSPCSSHISNMDRLKENKHPSQNPLSRTRYIEKLKKSKKDNFSELKVEQALRELGYSVALYSHGDEADWIREYPVKCVDGEKNRCFYIDFYNSKLNLALEIDGAAFHSYERDSKRDSLITNSIGAHIIRIPAKKVFNKNFTNTTLNTICKNHEGQIGFLPAPWFRIKKVNQKKFSGLNRRWDITVEKESSFICSGILIHNSGDMTEDLLRNNPKISKDGSRYKAIPFDQAKAPSQTPISVRMFANQVKSELKTRNISYKKIEYNKDGSPRLGRLHTIKDISSLKPSARASHGALSGLTIFQSITKSGNVRRDIMTFRVVSSKHKGSKWIHPGLEGKKLMDEALEWASNVWDKEILPAILERFSK